MRVWVNGTFDVLHVGHVSLLQFASLFGKVRVGIDTDRRVKELKGDDRPFHSEEERKYNLERIKGGIIKVCEVNFAEITLDPIRGS